MTTAGNARGIQETALAGERLAEALARTAAVDQRVEALRRVLADSLDHPVRIPFAALRREPVLRPFAPGDDEVVPPAPVWEDYAIPEPSRLHRLLHHGQVEAARQRAQARFAYRRDTARLLVVFDLPGPEVIPATAGFRYVRTRDAIDERPRPLRERKQLYADLIGRLALVRIHDAFATCTREIVTEVALSAHVPVRDQATGRPTRPCLVSVVAGRTRFGELPLTELEPAECLRRLDARLSPHPYDLQPVTPFFDPAEVRH